MAAAATLRGFAAAPGRRVAILLSGGWPYDVPAYVANQLARPVVEPGAPWAHRIDPDPLSR